MVGIEYPKRNSEAEIQAVLWSKLRNNNIDARLQVTSFNPKTNKKSWKLDLVVFVNQMAVCIVECKAWSKSYSKTTIYRHDNTGQLQKYRRVYGIPVLVCGTKEHINSILSQIENIVKAP